MRRLAHIALIFLTSCAVITGGGPWVVTVDSCPDGARVTYRGSYAGVTPCRVEVDSESSFVAITKDGYHMREVGSGGATWASLNRLTTTTNAKLRSRLTRDTVQEVPWK